RGRVGSRKSTNSQGLGRWLYVVSWGSSLPERGMARLGEGSGPSPPRWLVIRMYAVSLPIRLYGNIRFRAVYGTFQLICSIRRRSPVRRPWLRSLSLETSAKIGDGDRPAPAL